MNRERLNAPGAEDQQDEGQASTVDCEDNRKVWDAEERGNTAYCHGDMKGAAAEYAKGLKLSRACTGTAGHEFEAEVGTLLGHALARAGQWAAAEAALRKAILHSHYAEHLEVRSNPADDAAGFIDEKRRYLETYENAFRDLETALIRQGKIEDALLIADERRAVTVRQIRAARSGATSAGPRSTSDLRRIASSQAVTFVVYSATEYWPSAGFSNGPMLGRNCSAQPPARSLHIWVIGPSGRVESRSVDLSTPGLRAMAGDTDRSGAYLQAAVRHLRDVIAEKAPLTGASGTGAAAGERSSDALRFLYDLLIAPVADLLPTTPGAEVVFIPDGSLHYVPFAALQAKDGTYLIDRYTIRLLVSLGDVDTQTRSANQNAPSDHALVVANPRPMPDDLPPLFGAEREAESVATVLGTTPLIGDRATLQTVLERLPSAEIVHFATHALFDEEYGYMSYLVLVPPGPEGIRVATEDGMLFLSGDEGAAAKGHLTAETISDLHLRAKVAVLSACNTGRGDITGEGVSGLASAFLSAGAGSVVVALWSVPDLSTESLMTEFYHSLHGGSGTAAALREAMLKTRARTSSPRAWAGFELLGAGS